jgi:WD40 repeat protein
LSEQIRDALRQSAYLIIICSPRSARSHWVNEEVLEFKRSGRENRILALITEGEPNVADKPDCDPTLECFPQAIKLKLGPDGELSTLRTEPVAADVRPQGDGRENAKLKLIAGLLGVNFDALKQRELEAARKRTRIAYGIAATMLLFAIAAGSAGVMAYLAELKAERQLDEALSQRARFLTTKADDARRTGAPDQALLLLGEAVKVAEKRTRTLLPWFARVTLVRSVSAVTAQRLLLHDDVVRMATFSPDGRHVLTASSDKTTRVWDAETGRLLLTLDGHREPVVSVAFSPDGRHVLAASVDGSASLWRLDDGKLQRRLEGHTGEVSAASFSPTGDRILTASHDGTAAIWDARAGTRMTILPDQGPLRSAIFSADGRHVLTGSADGAAYLLDGTTGRLLHKFAGHGDAVVDARLSPDGRTVVTASEDKTARVWDTGSGEQHYALTHEGALNTAEFSRDGRLIATASHDKTARLWDARTGKLIHRLDGHQDNVRATAFSPDGRYLLTASSDNTARLWEVESGAFLQALQGHQGYVHSVAFSPDGGSALTASLDKTARIWSLDRGIPARTFREHAATVNTAVFSADGSRVLTASYDKTARLWDAATGLTLQTFKGHADNVTSAALSPDMKRVLTGSVDRTARLWDAKTGAPDITLRDHQRNVNSVAYSPDGRLLLTAADDRTVRVWQAEKSEPFVPAKAGTQGSEPSDQSKRLLGSRLRGNERESESAQTRHALVHTLGGHAGDVNSARFSPDGRRIASASSDGARLWDTTTGELVRRLDGHQGYLNAVAFSTDGKLLLTTSDDRTARIWDAETGAPLRALLGHQKRVYGGAFSPDGRLIATSSEDGIVCLWDTATGMLLQTFEGHRDVVNDVTFGLDGRRLLTASNDKTARTWDIAAASALAPEDAWDWVRIIALRPLTFEERREASLVDSAPDAPARDVAQELAWLDMSRPTDMASLKAAAERGSWGASLRLGELHERDGDLLQALRAYAMAAERLDAELSLNEKTDLALRSYAERAFARRGSLAQYLTRRNEVAAVARISREVQAWRRRLGD